MKNTRPVWYPDWAGRTVVIVASGPSAAFVNLDCGIGRAKFVAINRSITLAPWSDIWYCCDFQWWSKYYGDAEFRKEVGEHKRALKVCVDYRIRECKTWGVKFLYCDKQDDTIVMHPGRVGWGGNSGFNCLNMVVQFEPAKIILVGYDMTKASGAHWHDPHPRGLSNPTNHSIERWRRVMENAAKPLREAGIVVINCSDVSVLQKFPKMSFEQALEYDGPPYLPQGRGQMQQPPDPPEVIAARRAAAEAVVRGVIAKHGNGNRRVPDAQINYIANRLAERM